ncbi:MAG: TIGR03617 family F420-dependent LLM class oxidoreductase [Ardenticatenaceae bacterium]|nr:TIGR03617 family F420-dependent LLM class oxidoreductase [Ardenticatenaceae bacterium]
MKFDVTVLNPRLGEMGALVQAAEALGFDGLWTAETNSDPFLPLAVAAEHSQRMNIGTAIAVTFPRSPTVLATMAWDLARFSNGRFILGLGAQIKAHNERRFGARWEKPIRKMRETIEAIRAVWDCWQNGSPLNYEGEFFKLNLMTPFFHSGPLPHAAPPIYISAVNEQMLHLAGSHGDGVHVHAFHTARYLREFALPALAEGLRKSGRERGEFGVNTAVFAIPTDGPKPVAEYEQFARQQISFYMSTPAYKVVSDLHGWSETAWKLGKTAVRGQWAEMPKQITDEMLDTFAVTGTWAELPGKIKERYGHMLTRVGYYLPFVPGECDEQWAATIDGFK